MVAIIDDSVIIIKRNNNMHKSKSTIHKVPTFIIMNEQHYNQDFDGFDCFDCFDYDIESNIISDKLYKLDGFEFDCDKQIFIKIDDN